MPEMLLSLLYGVGAGVVFAIGAPLLAVGFDSLVIATSVFVLAAAAVAGAIFGLVGAIVVVTTFLP